MILSMLLFFMLCFTVSVHAEGVQPEDFGADQVAAALPDAAVDAFGELSVSDAADLPDRLEQLWAFFTGQGQDLLFSALRSAGALLMITFLTALCGVLTESKWVSLCGMISLSVLSLEHVSSCLQVGLEALEQLKSFSMVLLPCLSTAAFVSGAVTSAGVKYGASMLFFDGIIGLMLRFAVPILHGYLAVMLSAKLTDNPMLQSMTNLLRQGMKWALILLSVCFTLYLSITGLLASTADAAAAKTAKTVLASALPVVGSILSDASAALLGGAAMVRNGVGVLGLLAVLALCVTPYLTLGFHYLFYRAAAILAQSYCSKPMGSMLDGFGDVFAFLLGMVGTAALILFVSVISMMKAVGVG